MTEAELKKWERQLKKREVLIRILERDLQIYTKRIEKHYKKAFPELKFKVRSI